MTFLWGTAFLQMLPSATIKCFDSMCREQSRSINALLNKVVISALKLRIYEWGSVQRCEVIIDSILANRLNSLGKNTIYKRNTWESIECLTWIQSIESRVYELKFAS